MVICENIKQLLTSWDSPHPKSYALKHKLSINFIVFICCNNIKSPHSKISPEKDGDKEVPLDLQNL